MTDEKIIKADGNIENNSEINSSSVQTQNKENDNPPLSNTTKSTATLFPLQTMLASLAILLAIIAIFVASYIWNNTKNTLLQQRENQNQQSILAMNLQQETA